MSRRFISHAPVAARLTALGLASALTACMNLQPKYERPAAPVAGTLAYATAPTGSESTGIAPSAQDWHAYFKDARLALLISAALANNRDLRVSVLNIEVARAQVGLRRADEFPTVVGQATHMTRVTGTQTIDTVGLAVSAYELDLLRVASGSLTDAALAQLSSTEEARKSAQISLVASVANAYYAMAGDDALVDVAQRTLDTRTKTLDLMQKSLRQRRRPPASTCSSTAPWSTSARVAPAVQAARASAALDQNALELLVGGPLPASLPPAPDWDAMSLPDVPVGLTSDVLLARPDVRQAEQQLVAANADIGAARAAFFPTISLTGSYGTASTSLNHLFEHAAWTFIPQITVPIFDAGRNRANLRVSEAQRDIATAQYEKAVQSAFKDVADALAGRATLVEQLDAQQAVTNGEAERFKLSNMLYTAGVASSLDQLDAQRSLFLAQLALVQTKLALLQNRIAVYRALGGGWVEPAAAATLSQSH